MPRERAWEDIFPQGRSFVKMQGLHNHFVIVDGRETPYRPTTSEVIQICDVRTGVGAEQLIVVEPPRQRGIDAGAYAFMRIININGIEAEACGNATRCFAWLMFEETGKDQLILETVAGPLVCTRAGSHQVQVEMGVIRTEWHQIPLATECDTLHLPVGNGPLRDPVAVNVGNPHIVYFVDDLSSVDMTSLSPAIQNDPLFPEQVNVGVAQVVRGDYIRLSVYERPGILTSACGSGACAAVKAAHLRGKTHKRSITVEMSAGAMEIELREDDVVVMTGPVDYCFSGTLSDQMGGLVECRTS